MYVHVHILPQHFSHVCLLQYCNCTAILSYCRLLILFQHQYIHTRVLCMHKSRYTHRYTCTYSIQEHTLNLAVTHHVSTKHATFCFSFRINSQYFEYQSVKIFYYLIDVFKQLSKKIQPNAVIVFHLII